MARTASIRIAFPLLLLLSAISVAPAQTRTVGLLQYDSTASAFGYTIFPPTRSNRTYLIDNCGQLVNMWLSDYKPGLSAYLLQDGSLLRCGIDEFSPTFRQGGGVGGHLEIRDWDGSLVWDYLLSDAYQCQHHDAIMLPNGNVLALAWELHTDADAIANGRDPAGIQEGEIWSEKLVELRPILPDSAEIVWEWNVWDHLIQDFDSTRPNYGTVGDHPELLDLNLDPLGNGKKDWLHFNSIAYHAGEDQIALSSRNASEIYLIDHSTSTAEAAGHSGGRSGKGGDFLWRWGNPEAYHRGDSSTRVFYWQHHPNWIDAGYINGGKMLVFNNGTYRPGLDHSSVDMLELNPDANGNYALNASGTYLPDTLAWQYTSPSLPDFHSPFISGAQGLPNGNILISDGNHGLIFEVDLDRKTNWKYRNPDIGNSIISQGDTIPGISVSNQLVNSLFRAERYMPSYPGLAGRDLTPNGPVESDPAPVPCYLLGRPETAARPAISVFPNPAEHVFHVALPVRKTVKYRIVDLMGRKKASGTMRAGGLDVFVQSWQPGCYLLLVEGFRPAKILVER